MGKNMFKKTITKLAVVASLVPAVSMGASVEDRLSELEANSSLNIFKFSGALETRYDSLKSEQTTPTASKFNETVDYMRLKFSFNIDADISDKIKFYSRLSTSKFFNTYNSPKANATTAPSTSADLFIGKGEKGAQVYLEKAYADVNIADSGAVFSFGRLSTFEGPPFNLPYGRARMGTYPGLLYNAELDGLALTYNGKVGEGSFAARAVHTPFSYWNDATGTVGSNGLLVSPRVGAQKSETTIGLSSLMLEYNNDQLSVGKLTVIAQAWQTGWLQINGSEVNLGGGAGTGSIGFKIGAQAVHVDLESVMQSNFDLSATVLASKVENRGSATVTGLGTIFGQGATTQDEIIPGASTLLAARYKYGRSYVGAEYLNGGSTAFVYDSNNDPISGFYSTTGTGTHAYILHKITNELAFRFGAMKQEYKKSAFSLGAQTDSDRKIDTYYANLRLDF